MANACFPLLNRFARLGQTSDIRPNFSVDMHSDAKMGTHIPTFRCPVEGLEGPTRRFQGAIASPADPKTLRDSLVQCLRRGNSPSGVYPEHKSDRRMPYRVPLQTMWISRLL